ncbi:MAG: hypothetical protein A4E74_02229 [Syntrophus sp. PtaB.Bin075]|nr:MAG: hypothetical protein A4E74_02229 [Syntrophus sp. PtaB.Bin075]
MKKERKVEKKESGIERRAFLKTAMAGTTSK